MTDDAPTLVPDTTLPDPTLPDATFPNDGTSPDAVHPESTPSAPAPPDTTPPEPAPPEPVVGSAVRDSARDRVGRVMAREGSRLQLRPLTGGREWDADPNTVQLLSHLELLSARVAETNARSRTDRP